MAFKPGRDDDGMLADINVPAATIQTPHAACQPHGEFAT